VDLRSGLERPPEAAVSNDRVKASFVDISSVLDEE
jgi:hypothetical protein